jgi:hypothetical protein
MGEKLTNLRRGKIRGENMRENEKTRENERK